MMSDAIQLVIAGATCLTGGATAVLAWFVYSQLGHLQTQVSLLKDQVSLQLEQIQASSLDKRKWHTVTACQDYSKEPILNGAMMSLWSKTSCGTDYTVLPEYDRDVLLVLDYLENLAIAVEQETYDENIIKDNLEQMVQKAVKAFIFGESGNLHGRDWKASKPIYPRECYPHVLGLYNKWFDSQP